VVNPATGAVLRELTPASRGDVEAALARARAAQPAWASLPVAERAQALRRLSRLIRDDEGLVRTLVAESGKPLYEAMGIEIFYTLELTRYYTGRAGRRALRDEVRRPLVFAYKRARVVRHPVGVVGVIGPWNWPLLNNYADCVAPLLAGNAVLLKPSEWTPLTSLRVGELALEAGLPRGVLEVLPGRADVGEALCDGCDMIFFTGSQASGRKVAARCGERLIPVVLELGGKSPMIVLEDANLRRAARAAVWSGFAHSGQVCIRTEQVLVQESVAEAFTELCRAEVQALRQGSPLRPPEHPGDEPAPAVDVDVGAITFPPQVTRAEAQIADAVARGGRVLVGGSRRADLSGTFFRPTLIADATPEMKVVKEETFGPVLPIVKVRDAEEALRIANASPLGLSGSVWTADRARGRALARRLAAGSVCVNDALVNYFVVEAPLGGVKSSGVGVRHGPEGLRQFCRIETIVEDHPLLRWLNPLVSRQLMFPYRNRTLRILRWVMRRLY
jgi:acyl-CoA reductase-like NAD-dependent aldehyde dehydrogenase